MKATWWCVTHAFEIYVLGIKVNATNYHLTCLAENSTPQIFCDYFVPCQCT